MVWVQRWVHGLASKSLFSGLSLHPRHAVALNAQDERERTRALRGKLQHCLGGRAAAERASPQLYGIVSFGDPHGVMLFRLLLNKDCCKVGFNICRLVDSLFCSH